ncbi:hypothetical protein KIKIMORA_00310 [Brevundimonas phage vB_BpoS-Kikimora]|uniref:Uncharacterized protein n=2 Tax=Kikimoravirus TaxID=3425051 RepID=A0A9E7N3X8_9CAUD|nr:hypothetical protein KIKIMORA_00310 [Brevundimonas phage vB_BpoS-Kikimora]UTC28067.1 hypothetical protein GURKE_00350 [Brevundimonas phage vB_BpoS-Gurke]
MGRYQPPTMAEIIELWERGAGGKQEIRRVLIGRNLRRALMTSCSTSDLRDILSAVVDDLYPSSRERYFTKD